MGSTRQRHHNHCIAKNNIVSQKWLPLFLLLSLSLSPFIGRACTCCRNKCFTAVLVTGRVRGRNHAPRHSSAQRMLAPNTVLGARTRCTRAPAQSYLPRYDQPPTPATCKVQCASADRYIEQTNLFEIAMYKKKQQKPVDDREARKIRWHKVSHAS
jgi:hypothetical protein